MRNFDDIGKKSSKKEKYWQKNLLDDLYREVGPPPQYKKIQKMGGNTFKNNN